MNKKDEILLHDYFDNLLTEAEQKEFEETLFDNLDLAIDLGKLKNLQRNLRNLTSQFEPSEKVIENIIDSLLEEQKEVTQKDDHETNKKEKKKKSKKKKVRKGLRAKTKFRLKRILTFSLFVVAIGIIGTGYYFYQKENSSFPWKVTPISEKTSTKLQSVIMDGVNSHDVVSTSSNESISISILNKAIITLEEESEIEIIAGTQSSNSIRLKKGGLNFIPQSNNILFKLYCKDIVITSKNSHFEIKMKDKDNASVRVINNFIVVNANGDESKIPKNHLFRFLGSNNITIPTLVNANKSFLDLVHKYTLEPDDKTINKILSLAKKENTFTLFFMLKRVTPINRELILEKLQQYSPLPNSISKVDLLMLDNTALNTWWDEIYSSM